MRIVRNVTKIFFCLCSLLNMLAERVFLLCGRSWRTLFRVNWRATPRPPNNNSLFVCCYTFSRRTFNLIPTPHRSWIYFELKHVSLGSLCCNKTGNHYFLFRSELYVPRLFLQVGCHCFSFHLFPCLAVNFCFIGKSRDRFVLFRRRRNCASISLLLSTFC